LTTKANGHRIDKPGRKYGFKNRIRSNRFKHRIGFKEGILRRQKRVVQLFVAVTLALAVGSSATASKHSHSRGSKVAPRNGSKDQSAKKSKKDLKHSKETNAKGGKEPKHSKDTKATAQDVKGSKARRTRESRIADERHNKHSKTADREVTRRGSKRDDSRLASDARKGDGRFARRNKSRQPVDTRVSRVAGNAFEKTEPHGSIDIAKADAEPSRETENVEVNAGNSTTRDMRSVWAAPATEVTSAEVTSAEAKRPETEIVETRQIETSSAEAKHAEAATAVETRVAERYVARDGARDVNEVDAVKPKYAVIVKTTTENAGPALGTEPGTVPGAVKAEIEKSAAEPLAVIPPAPMILKRNPKAIAIPPQESLLKPKFEEKSAVDTNAKVGSSFGYRRDPFTRRAKFHSGLDIKAKLGDPVGASSHGVVQYAGWYHGYGNVVIVEHGGGVTTHYAHLTSFAVEVGQVVSRGSIVGYAGSTGRATSPHLHYEVRIDGNAVNPLDPVVLDEGSDYFKRIKLASSTGRAQSQPAELKEPASRKAPVAAPEPKKSEPPVAKKKSCEM
jgi:murein DD-endopeptidase MepM/ murein hydrolase activator NlpD